MRWKGVKIKNNTGNKFIDSSLLPYIIKLFFKSLGIKPDLKYSFALNSIA